MNIIRRALLTPVLVFMADTGSPPRRLKVEKKATYVPKKGTLNPRSKQTKKVKRAIRPKKGDKEGVRSASGGTKKKKLKKKPEFVSYPVANGQETPPPPTDLKDVDHDEAESFMVGLEEAKNGNNKDGPSITNGNTEASMPENNGAPAFGESLKVGFRKRNSKRRTIREAKSVKTREPGSDVDPSPNAKADEGSVVTDIDDESFIEWDPGSTDGDGENEVAPSAEDELIELGKRDLGDFLCRNCNEPITQRYIKSFTRKQNNYATEVTGPFCSKLCSLEYQ